VLTYHSVKKNGDHSIQESTSMEYKEQWGVQAVGLYLQQQQYIRV
jgi:hypothetical protein